MEELLAQGVDPGAHSGGGTIMGPCESLNPDGLRFLLEHGADPNYRDRDGSALDMILNTYQHEHREECLELLVQAGASYTDGAEMDILGGGSTCCGRGWPGIPGSWTPTQVSGRRGKRDSAAFSAGRPFTGQPSCISAPSTGTSRRPGS